MRSTSLGLALSLCVFLSAACQSSTGLNGCNLPAEAVSVTPVSPSVTGVVQRVKVGGVGYSPEGYDPWTQVDAFVSIPVDNGSAHVTVDIILGKSIPVLLQQSGEAPRPISACHLRIGDKVTVWAPLQGVFAGGFVGPLGDTTSLQDASFVAEKLVIDLAD